MGFTSHDDLLNKTTNLGQLQPCSFNKVTGAGAYTAGRFYDFSILGGNPVANTFAGTALAWASANESSGFGIRHGGNVSTATKHLMNIFAMTSSATGVPGILYLLDMQGYYPGINVNVGTAQTLTGAPTLRYASGAGLRAFTVATVASGATAHNIAMSYTNQAATAGRALGATTAMTPSAIVGHMAHTGTAANNYGPFLPLAAGDTGIQSVQSVTFSAASGAGTCALVLARPLAKIPLAQVSLASERDLINQLFSAPQVIDGACLTLIYYAGAATGASSSFFGDFDVAWG